jgi:hypothetical protein
MKRVATTLLALMLVTSCSRQPAASKSAELNTTESVTSKQVMHEGQPWIEVTLSQRVDSKSPAYVTGIRESKWINRLSWALVEQTISADRVISRFRFKPAIGTNEIILTRDDFEWFPPISGFAPVEITIKPAEPDAAGNSRHASQ